MVRVRVAVLFLLCLFSVVAVAQDTPVLDGFTSPSSIPDANAYRMVYLSWADVLNNGEAVKLENTLRDQGFVYSDILVIENQLSTFTGQFNAVTPALTANQDVLVSDTTTALQYNLSPTGASLLTSYIQSEKSRMQVYLDSNPGVAPTYARHGITTYYPLFNAAWPQVDQEAEFYGDSYESGINIDVTCYDLVVNPPVFTFNSVSNTGSLASNRGWVFRNIAPTTYQTFVNQTVWLNVGNTLYCGTRIIKTMNVTFTIEAATTRVRNLQGLGTCYQNRAGITECQWTVSPSCSNIPVWAFPDFDPNYITDAPQFPTPWGWDAKGLCVRALGSGWHCADTYTSVRYNTNVGPSNSCTYNP